MASTAYATPEQAVTALRPGWKIVGQRPYEVELPNPAKTPSNSSAPATIKTTIGTTLSIEGPNGEPDEMTISTLQALPSTTTGGARAAWATRSSRGRRRDRRAATRRPTL